MKLGLSSLALLAAGSIAVAIGCAGTSAPSAGGAIVAGRLRGASPEAYGQAVFLRPGITLLDPFTPGLQSHSPLALADGACANVSTTTDTSLATFLDAGPALTVADSAGTWTLAQQAGAYSGSAGVGVYTPASGLTVSGPGGVDIRSFSVTLASPSATTLLSPSLSGGLLKQALSSSLSLSWSAGGGSVWAEAFQGDGLTATAWACRFPDTGSATLTSSFWLHFQPSATVPDLSAGFVFYRANQQSIPIGGTSSFFTVDAWQSRLDLH